MTLYLAFEINKTIVNTIDYPFGAGGGTRTHTTFYGPRILSPVRLPFRHTGNCLFKSTYTDMITNNLTLCH